MTEIALSELRPVFRRIHKDFTPETGGTPTDEFELTFSCPTCGPPGRISILVGPSMDAVRHVWQVTPAVPPNGGGWPEIMTVSPSINNTGERRHGRSRPPCTFHGHIVSGKVVYP